MLLKFHRIILLSFLLISTPLFAETTLPSPQGTPVEPLDSIVAVVNNELITRKEYDQALAAAKRQVAEQHLRIKDEASLRKQVLDQLIYQHIQLQIAENSHVTVTQKEVNAAIKQVIQHSGLSKDAFVHKLSRSGVSYETFKDQIKKQMIIDKLQHQALAGKVQLSEKDIADFRELHHLTNNQFEYHVIDTVVYLPDNPSKQTLEAAEKKAQTLTRSLKQGGKIEDASQNDLGWLTLENLPEMFVGPINNMKVGSISKPLRAPNGLHIIQLAGRRHNSKAVSDEEIKNAIAHEKFLAALKKWLEEMRDSAYVHINQGAYDA